MAVKSYKWNDKTQLSPHFNVQEFRCKCGGQHDILIAEELVEHLELLFVALDCSMITINSGHRCASHDKAVGGSGSGFHVSGQAADIRCYDKKRVLISSKLVSCYAQEVGFGGIANIDASYQNTHADVRPNGKWYGNECVTTAYSVCTDFWKYYGITKESKKHPDLKIGDKGSDVLVMQSRLAVAGFLPEKECDGIFGPKTEAALVYYQFKNCNRVTGIYDQGTRNKLEED